MDRFEMVLKERQRILGMHHPDTLWAMESLVVVYRDMDRSEEAEILEAQLSKLKASI